MESSLNDLNNLKAAETQNASEECSILIVDDSRFSRVVLKEILKNAGYQVIIEAEDGLEAIDKVKETKPKCIFLDVEMPKMSGLAVLRKILENNPEAIVIMCSAMGKQQVIREAIKIGAKDFVTKPYKTENILEVIYSHLGLPKNVVPFKKKKKELEKVQKARETEAADSAAGQEVPADTGTSVDLPPAGPDSVPDVQPGTETAPESVILEQIELEPVEVEPESSEEEELAARETEQEAEAFWESVELEPVEAEPESLMEELTVRDPEPDAGPEPVALEAESLQEEELAVRETKPEVEAVSEPEVPEPEVAEPDASEDEGPAIRDLKPLEDEAPEPEKASMHSAPPAAADKQAAGAGKQSAALADSADPKREEEIEALNKQFSFLWDDRFAILPESVQSQEQKKRIFCHKIGIVDDGPDIMRDAALPDKEILHGIICTYLGNEVEFRQKQGSFKFRMFDFHGKGRVLTREVQTDDGRVYTDVSMAELFKLKPQKNRLMSRKTIYKTAPYQAIVKLVLNKRERKLGKDKIKLWEV